jgi:hypothetical protein
MVIIMMGEKCSHGYDDSFQYNYLTQIMKHS